MTWAQFLQYLVTLLQVQDSYGQAAFSDILPFLVQRAEDIIYQSAELDFLFTRDTDTSQRTVGGSRALPIPAQFITIEGLNIITPADTLPSVIGATRIPYFRTSRQFIDLTWPVESQTQAPDIFTGGYYALFDFQQASPAPGEDEPRALPSSILLGPTPDGSYIGEITGTLRPAAFSADNSPNTLSTYYPSLLVAATMVIASAWQRDWGASSEDPRVGLSWQTEFDRLKAVAAQQSQRQKSRMPGASPVAPPPLSPAEQYRAQVMAANAGGGGGG